MKYRIWIVLALILILSAGLRLWRINEYMTFLGDEGRDVLVVKRMIVDHKFTLLGPITSVGSIYMGPVYYYMMAPFLWLFGLNPVGPSIMVAIFAVFTVYILFRIGEEFFSQTVGLVASLLYATSPLTILYGRSSWNPNVVPFFSVLLMYGLMKTVIKKQYYWLLISAACLGTLIQLHYVTFLFFPIIACCLALIRFRIPLKVYVLAFFCFLIAYAPFLAFEFRHDFVNMRGAIRFGTEQQTGNSISVELIYKAISDIFIRLFWRLLIVQSAELTKVFLLVAGGTAVWIWKKRPHPSEYMLSSIIILLWFFVGLACYGAYHGVIYDYYMGSLFPVPFLLFGIMIDTWTRTRRLIWIGVSFLIVMALIIFHVLASPLRIEPNNLLKNTETIASFVSNKVRGKQYNFALIAGKNSDHAYRYFLEIWGNPPVVIENPAVDPERKTVMPELWIICEESVCQPLGHPLWEIAGFGPAQIVHEWKVSTARVFELQHISQE